MLFDSFEKNIHNRQIYKIRKQISGCQGIGQQATRSDYLMDMERSSTVIKMCSN